MNLDKLKEAARKYEQREEWRRAIDVYLQAIREAEDGGEEGTQDPGLYNRVGDLQLKAGDTLAGLRAYEEAAGLYADQGFFNNAIALCGKILRINPGRNATYLRLAQLHARKNFVGEAKKNLVEYLERMNGVGQVEEAFAALKLFADQFSANPDIRLMLVELLRASSRNEEAREQLEKLAEELEARGDNFGARRTRERLQSIGDAATTSRPPTNELVFIDTGLHPLVEPTALNGMADSAAAGSALDQPAEPLPFDDPTLELLEEDVGPLPSSASRAPSDPARLSDALAASDFAPRAESGMLLRDRAKQLLEAGERLAGLHAMEDALRQLEAESRWEEALQVAAELVRLEPTEIPRFQKQVELAYYAGRRSALIGAYVELADALMRAEATEHAAQVYRRVLEHDPGNAEARVALDLIEAAQPEPAVGPEGFIDLGSLILGEEAPKDTRMRVGQKEEIEDEDRAFQEALADFKRGIEANIEASDFQSHYDLGIAFKEMGLVDDAIAEFQKALRSSEGRLKTSEQLGIAFFEQSQFGIAESVLRRAVHTLPGDEDEKVGLIYWLGRALEAQGKVQEALPCYEATLAVDIRFLDVRDRARRLRAEAQA